MSNPVGEFGEGSALVPDLPEPIRAYRAWSMSGYRLEGAGGVVWPPGEPLLARCNKYRPEDDGDRYRRMMSAHSRYATYGGDEPMPEADHECPSPGVGNHGGYGCGIYAYKTFGDAFAHAGLDQVVGIVELGGKVYEHANGYRAEYAIPVALYKTGQRDLSLVAAVYEVPVHEPDWEAEAAALRGRVAADVERQSEKWDANKARLLAERESRQGRRSLEPPYASEYERLLGEVRAANYGTRSAARRRRGLWRG